MRPTSTPSSTWPKHGGKEGRSASCSVFLLLAGDQCFENLRGDSDDEQTDTGDDTKEEFHVKKEESLQEKFGRCFVFVRRWVSRFESSDCLFVSAAAVYCRSLRRKGLQRVPFACSSEEKKNSDIIKLNTSCLTFISNRLQPRRRRSSDDGSTNVTS